MRFLATAVVTAAFVLFGANASAMPPDFNGERGLEGSIFLGGGSLFDTSERLFWNPSQVPPGTPPNAINGGFDLGFAAGYRFLPYLSAGVSAQVLFVTADPVVGITRYDASASCYAIGAYARLYPATFIFHDRDARRAVFTGVLDTRRLDPWVSLGIEYEMLTRTETEPGGLRGATWYRNSIGVPIQLGLDVRVLPALAVGISLGVAPWFGGWGTDDAYNIVQGNAMHTVSSFNSVDTVTGEYTIGLDARYTFTW